MPEWWKLKPLYFVSSESDLAPAGYPGAILIAKGFIVPILRGGVALVWVPWSRHSYVRFFDWSGSFNIPGLPDNVRPLPAPRHTNNVAL